MIRDLFRVSLILLLFISVLLISGVFIIEIIYSGFTILRLIITSILCMTQISLAIMLCSTKHLKTLLSCLIVNIVIIIILFSIEFTYLSDFVNNNRQKFFELIEKYPDGSQPTEWHLILHYVLIKEQKCCGIDRRANLLSEHDNYFIKYFLVNCLQMSRHPFTYQGQPCINFVHDVHHLLFRMSVIKIIFITFVLILFGVYIFVSRRPKNRTIDQYPILPRYDKQ